MIKFHLLDHNFMNELFPFYVLFDKNMNVINHGNSINKIYPLEKNNAFEKYFLIKRPISVIPSFENIKKQRDSLFIIECLNADLQLRGQMYFEKDSSLVCFLGTPLIQSLNELNKIKLDLQDFATHDNISQFLFSLQMYISSLNDTQEIADKLKNSNKRLQESNSAMDEFMYRLTHDLRAPAININNMIKMLNMIHTFDSNEKSKLIFDNLNTSSHKLLKIIDDFLMVSQTERSEKQNCGIHNLESEFDAVQKSLQSIIEETNTTINYHFEAKDIFISLEDLRSILQNLLHNAIKYSVIKNPPIITINSYYEKDMLIIKMKDNGIGIDTEKHKNKLFKMFSRLHTDTNTKGTGIGLYLIKQLVKRNNGEITVESNEGDGSQFTLLFSNEKD